METNKIQSVFLSTYPPKACGIATFTQDLVRELDRQPGLASPRVVAVGDAEYQYSGRVVGEIRQQRREEYGRAAVKLNQSDADIVVIEHEYGIFGGQDGEYVLDFADRLELPFVVTLHTVLSSPTGGQRRVLNRLGQRAQKVVTMAKNSVPILRDIYRIDPEKIVVVPHGVPVREREPREALKKRFGLEGRSVVSTFGLLSPGKGLEYGIRAVADAARTHPEILYLILGQTHPVVRARYGEGYREMLQKLVEQCHAVGNVRFVNRYLTKDEIIRYLELSDIYMTPYLGREQAVSGTLAYAVGYGRVVVSTPYRYAQEVLADGRGLLAGFRDPVSLSKQLCYVLEHPEQKREMERRTLRYGAQMLWFNVADAYRALFERTVHREEVGRRA